MRGQTYNQSQRAQITMLQNEINSLENPSDWVVIDLGRTRNVLVERFIIMLSIEATGRVVVHQ